MAEPGRWRWRNLPVPEAHLGLLATGLVLHRWRPWPLSSGGWTRRIGWPLVGAGLALALWATRAAGRTDLAEPDELVTTGPYALTRHPMYAAWTIIYLGATLVADTRWLLAGVPLLGVLGRREARREEAHLEDVFGADHARYRAAVRRWL